MERSRHRQLVRGRLVWVALVATLALLGSSCSSDDDEAAPAATSTTVARAPGVVPSVTVPAAAGKGIQAIATDLPYGPMGFQREEFFFSGDAVAYEKKGEWAKDGEWDVEETDTAAYLSRMVIIRPKDAADFNGTVYVEWFNVTGGLDAGATWVSGHNQMLRSGAAWVGVTAQSAGIVGSATTVESSAVEIPKGGLSKSDPARYGTLSHPGDLYSYDIFTQAANAIRANGEGTDPLGGLEAKRLIAVGESQSAGRLTTYVNAVHPKTRAFDGYFIFSRGANAAPLGTREQGAPLDPALEGALVRTDVDVPVFALEAEYDVLNGYADARQPNSKHFHAWEVAGTSHQDSYSAGGYAFNDLGDGEAEANILNPAKANGGLLNCRAPINAGGLQAVTASSLSHLEAWVVKGTKPPAFERLETSGTGANITVARDELGNAKGGARTPIVDVPLAANTGELDNAPDFCRVFGFTRPFDAATLARLYPGGAAEYVEAFDEAVDEAVEDGLWLEPEAENFKAAARKITFG
jgi:hypothetical protein